jgi:hypothetical protein
MSVDVGVLCSDAGVVALVNAGDDTSSTVRSMRRFMMVGRVSMMKKRITTCNCENNLYVNVRLFAGDIDSSSASNRSILRGS